MKKIFGSLQYTKPSWLQKFSDKLNANPERTKKVFISLGALVAVVIGGLWAKNYYDNRPQPDAVTVKVGRIYEYNFEKPEARSLYLTFSKSAASADAIGKPIAEGIKLKPEIKGQWSWVSDKELKFTPIMEKGKSDWPIGEKFEGRISKKILGPNIILKDYDFTFQVEPLKAYSISSGFHQDPRFADNKKVIATFNFN